ncbi:MAG TPA: hypothetical protein VJY35_07530 [Candidatus Eisenbacteria bacterium]|nr:hypothetical protein [Candidatus Eisenbacteria bacterium]
MKLHRRPFTGWLLVVATALAALAPIASADDDRDDRDRRDGRRYESRRDRDRRGDVRRDRDYDQRARKTVRWAYRAFGGRDERSYFYREVSTGRTHSHITFFRPDHAGRANGPIEMIDKRSGCVLHVYVWDGDEWDECGADYARYQGRGRGRDQYVYNDGYHR